MAMHEIGISGCRILVNDGIVRKISPNASYNSRLNSQMRKQIFFGNKRLHNVIVPKVISSGVSDGLFYFDMEYVHGKLFTEMFQCSSKRSLDMYINFIFEHLLLCRRSANEYGNKEFSSVVIDKLISLREASRYKEFIDYLSVKKLEPIEKSICHGDLTLSNILFLDSRLCFLDFLDSYINSYIMDIIKLKQDLYYTWYLNFLPVDDVYTARIRQVSNYIWRLIETEYPIVNNETFHVLDAINYLRIEPYVKSEKQISVLDNTLKRTVLYDKFNSPDVGKLD